MAHSKVLVVENDPDFAEIICEAGALLSCDAVVAMRADEALKVAREDMPEIIILGHLELRGEASRLRTLLKGDEKANAIPILVVDVAQENANRSGWRRDEGMMDTEYYLQRPISSAELAMHIGKMLAKEETLGVEAFLRKERCLRNSLLATRFDSRKAQQFTRMRTLY